MAAETVTVVFTDLVGSTELLSRVGEATADELRREHFALLRATIVEHGGREVKNLGDGLMIAFDGVTGALACAVAMQQAIAGRPADAEPLAVRVGVAVGDAEFEDGDYFGLPVVEAARLCATAEGGEILTTDFVRMLARSRSEIELEPLGTRELKGLEEPVETFRVRWAPVVPVEAHAPLPSRLASARSTNFVGRDAERAQLASAWKTVASGERRVMLLAGEPGIGKTTLSAQFASDVHDLGALVVYGRSDEDLGVPYQPWIESLTQVVAQAPEAVLAAHVADRGAHLGRMVPELARRLGCEIPASSDPDTERFVLYGCVSDLLARVSGVQPVLVVLDDLHWTDRASVQLLRHVMMTDREIRIGVLGTFRDSEVDARHPVAELLAALHREGCVDRIALRGFGDDELLALLEVVAGHEMDRQGVALRDALLAETAGNPFFVGEILRHLSETGTIYQREDGRWTADADLRAVGLPVSVREVIGRRLAGLGADTERVLALGAVIGRDFDVALLSAVAAMDEDTVLDLCDAAVAAAILRTTEVPDRYTFAHALIEHTLYDGLSLGRRTRAHKAIAERLEALTPSDRDERVGELAYHWAQAVQPTDLNKAIHYAHIAADRALEQLAPDDALRWYTQALELLERMPEPDNRQRAELLVGLGDAQRQCGVAAHRETLLDAAHLADSIGAVDLLVRAAVTNNRGFTSVIGMVDRERLAVIDRALEVLGRDDPANRARLLALASSERLYDTDLDERRGLAEQGLAAARESADPAALLFALQRPITSVTAPETVALRTAWTDEGFAVADELADNASRYWAHNAAMLTAVDRCDLPNVVRHFALMEETAELVPHAVIRWNIVFLRVVPTMLRGELAETERLAETGLAMGTEAGAPDALTIFGVQLTAIRLHQGRFGELVALAEQALADAPDLEAYRAALMLMKFHAGAHDDARQMLMDDYVAGFAVRLDTGWSVAHAHWAELAYRLGATEVVPLLRSRMLPYHELMITTTISVFPVFAYYLGLLDHLTGRLDDADAWFRESMELHERLESPLLIAYTQAAWAALLVDRNRADDHEHARSMAEGALAASTTGGYGYIEADARAVLERLS